MEKFVYKARDRQGELSSGQISASSLEEAGKMLVAQGKFVVNITAAKGGSSKETSSSARARCSSWASASKNKPSGLAPKFWWSPTPWSRSTTAPR